MEYPTHDSQLHGEGGRPENKSYIPLLCFLSFVYLCYLYYLPHRVARQKPPVLEVKLTLVHENLPDVERIELTPVHKNSTDLPGVEMAAMVDDMDDLSLELAIALQLEDVGVVIAARKGKGRAGDAVTSNDEAAFNDYRRHLEISAQILLDQRLARSVDRAVRTDAGELMRVTRAELRDESDRELALRLSEDPATKLVKNNSQWRPLAIGSGIEATDTDIAKWIQKSIEWDVREPQVLSPVASGAAII